jgi:hypothetical protein
MKLTEDQIERIKELESDGRRITPAAVVEDARQKGSPLHSLFEWNTRKAAEQHWIQTAREIIGAVHVQHTTQHYSIKGVAYVRDPGANGAQGYQHIEALRRDPSSSRESLIYTLEVAAGHLRRAYDLAVVLGMEGEIDALMAQVAGVQRQIRDAA